MNGANHCLTSTTHEDLQQASTQNKSSQRGVLRLPFAMGEDNKGYTFFREQVFQITREFPLLSAWKDFKYWRGFLQGSKSLVKVTFNFPKFPFADGLTCEGDEDSSSLLSRFSEDRKQQTATGGRPSTSNGERELVSSFLRDLNHFISKSENPSTDVAAASSVLTNFDFVSVLFEDLDLVGTENVESASSDFRAIALKYVDSLGQPHIVHFTIPQHYPKEKVKVVVDLPPQSGHTMEWPNRLSEAYNTFKSEVEKYVLFWSVMDELDSQVKIMDPIQPKRGDIHRRILLNQNVIVNLIFNPLSPKVIPDIKFSGPEKNVQALDLLVDQNYRNWSEDKSILENLEDLLQQEFTLKSDEGVGVDEEGGNLQAVCVICYAVEFDGNLPETTCECGSMFHDKCLSDLLVADCSTRVKRFCVECPACGMELKVAKAHKLSW